MTSPDLRRALEVAVLAAREAGDHLRRDFHRPGGARGHGDKAEADTEAERLIRARLLETFPSWGYLGEETGRGPAPAAGAPTWLVDPNDGTRDYLEGRRGSAVSIGLVAGGLPVLGVVFAFAYPDGDGDLFTWAEGCGPLRRNDRPSTPGPSAGLGADDVVLVSSTGDRDPAGHLECVAPARFRTVPSIAHRLALVAAGEAAATSALFAPREWDYGGGHALLRAGGGILVDETAAQVRYAEDATSRTQVALGGTPAAVEVLAQRPWSRLRGGTWGRERPVRLVRGEAVADSARLSRAQGCLLGLVAGGSAGTVGPRFEDKEETLAGQPTSDVEVALALARSIVARGRYAPEGARGEADELPPIGEGTAALVRATPLALIAPAKGADSVRDAATGSLMAAMAHVIGQGGGAEAAHRAAGAWVRRAGASADVTNALAQASSGAAVKGDRSRPAAVVALQDAFFTLLHSDGFESGVAAAVSRGGDTETSAAIVGALLGTVHGRPSIPARWRSLVLSCRPHALRTRLPRPRAYWPTDVLELAERLLLAGMKSPAASPSSIA